MSPPAWALASRLKHNRATHHLNERERRTQNNQTQSPLLHLPAELRITIYKYVLSQTRVINPNLHCAAEADLPLGSNVGLLVTCRQTRKESLPLFYSNSTFHLMWDMSYPCLIDFAGCGRIRSIEMSDWTLLTSGGPLGYKRLVSLEHCCVCIHQDTADVSLSCDQWKDVVHRTLGNTSIQVSVCYYAWEDFRYKRLS